MNCSTLNCIIPNFRMIIIIRKPNLHDLKWNVFLLPFSWRLWIAVGVTMFILTVCLTTIQHMRLYCQHVKKEDLSIVTSAMLITAIFLQKGRGVFFKSCICLSWTVHKILLELCVANSVETRKHLLWIKTQFPFFSLPCGRCIKHSKASSPQGAI